MDEVVAHPPCEAVIKMRVDEEENQWLVRLPEGIASERVSLAGSTLWLPDRYRTECRENKASHQPA